MSTLPLSRSSLMLGWKDSLMVGSFFSGTMKKECKLTDIHPTSGNFLITQATKALNCKTSLTPC